MISAKLLPSTPLRVLLFKNLNIKNLNKTTEGL
jgi:hypothetical protein